MVLVTANALANEVRNGGQLVAVQFVARAWTILESLESVQNELLTDEQLRAFHETLSVTRVEAVDGPLLSNDGLTVDARVVQDAGGKKVIEIDRAAWTSVMGSADSSKLIFHEYLRVLAIDDDQYQLSSKLPPDQHRDPTLGMGIYRVDSDTFFEITADQSFVAVAGKYWPLGYIVPGFDSDAAALTYRINFLSFFHYAATDNAFHSAAKNVAADYSDCAELVRDVTIRPSLDNRRLEIVATGPASVSEDCQHLYGTRTLLWTAVKVSP